jgi:ATP-dependent DNA ligase
MPASGLLFEKGKASNEILRLFERVRVAYLSARTDPKEYGSKWHSAVEYIRDEYDDSEEFGEELKNFINDKDLEHEDAKDATTTTAEKIYESVKNLRYSSDQVSDPFSKNFKGNVLEELLDNPESMVKFVHYAMRSDNKALKPSIYSVKDMEPDTITEGLMGLDLEVDDIPLYIIEHYGDGKDSKKVEKKVKAAMAMLELLFFSKHDEEDWDELKDIDMETDTPKKMIAKSETEKGKTDFITPNKPMYRIFEIDDMKELKGFTGEYIVQEKYDGMRIQIHKIDNKIKIYSFDEKDITSKCKEQVEELEKKHFGDCILDGVLLLFDGEKPLPRARVISQVFSDKNSDLKLKAHMFDIIRHNEKTIADEPLNDRLNIMFNNYSVHSSEYLNFPSKKDTRLADSIEDVEKYAKEIMDMPAAEGVVIKDATSTYYIGTRKNPKWIKWKSFVDLDLIVLDKKKKGNTYSYALGAGPTEGEGKEYETIEGNTYMNVGNAINTKIEADVGSIIRVKIDQVKKTGDKYSVYSAKAIEVPEVKMPDKLVTLELLSKDNKKELNYDVKALEKGIVITDYIHGEASIIIKGDMDGFTIYGFDEHNLMAKNAMLDLDVWKTQAEEIMKTKQGVLANEILLILEDGPKTVKEVHDALIKGKISEYKEIVKEGYSGLKNWAKQRDGIEYNPREKKLFKDPEKLQKDSEIIKEYKTPKEYQNGEFKLYLREDENLNLVIKLKDETLNWLIDLEKDDDIFKLFGKANKYPAQVAQNISKKKIIDSGKIGLGVQKNGYHEYFLKGNKFETKLHLRVLEAEGKTMWLAWTGYKQKPADKEGDAGLWNIYEDRYRKIGLPE